MSMIVTDTDSDQLNAVMAGGSFAAPGLREIESRHGVFNVEVLLAERVALSAQLAPLDAVSGQARWVMRKRNRCSTSSPPSTGSA